MFERINLETKYKDLAISELEKLAKKLDDEDAINEYVLRSVFSGRPLLEIGSNSSINYPAQDTDVYRLAASYLKKNPNHVLSNYVVGTYEGIYATPKNFKKANAYFRNVLSSNNKNMIAAASIARCRFLCNSYSDGIEKYASFTRALINGSVLAKRSIESSTLIFDNVIFGKPSAGAGRAIYIGEFLIAKLSGVQLNDFEHSNFLFSWDVTRRVRLLNANKSTNPIGDLDFGDSDIAWLMQAAINDDHEVFNDFMHRCKELNVITPELYLKIMNFFIHYVRDSAVRDKANYELFLACVNQNNLVHARDYLDAISETFSGFKMNDLAKLNSVQQVELGYRRFKSLYRWGRYDQAIQLLDQINKIHACHGYDEAVFDVFAKADPERANYNYFRIQCEAALKICAHGVTEGDGINLVSQELLKIADRLYQEELEPIEFELRCMFKDVLRQVAVYKANREARMCAEPNKHWGGQQQREDFYAVMNKLSQEQMLTVKQSKPIREAWKTLALKFYEAILRGSKAMPFHIGTTEIDKLFTALFESLKPINYKIYVEWDKPLKLKHKLKFNIDITDEIRRVFTEAVKTAQPMSAIYSEERQPDAPEYGVTTSVAAVLPPPYEALHTVVPAATSIAPAPVQYFYVPSQPMVANPNYHIPPGALDTNGNIKGFDAAAHDLMPLQKQPQPSAASTKSENEFFLLFPEVPVPLGALARQSIFAQTASSSVAPLEKKPVVVLSK